MADVIVIGAGHNGLVAAILLARAGLDVEVLERSSVVGGACRTETPFSRAPNLLASTGAYLLGLMPPELIAMLGLELPLVRRNPHSFTPTLDGRYLLLGADREDARRQIAAFGGEADARADDALQETLAALREDLAPAWLKPPMSAEETAHLYVRPALRRTFTNLVRGSAIDFISSFGFQSEEIVAAYAVTDGMPGLTGSPWRPGSGHNFLVHNMGRLPGSDGTWMVVRGGMGTVTQQLAGIAEREGVRVRTNTEAVKIAIDHGSVSGVVTSWGEEVRCKAVLAATDPFRLPDLLGRHTPGWLLESTRHWAEQSEGQTMKVNLALSDLPRFTALPERRGQHGTTVHMLPPPATDGSTLTAVREAYEAAEAGRIDKIPPIEWYLHSTLDPSLQDESGNHSSALFVQGVPHVPAGSDWATRKQAYLDNLFDLVELYAPGMRDLIVDVAALTPEEIASHFGITGGNIHHVDNAISFDQRVPYELGVDGVYAGGAGCHPAGSVIGCAGHNAAQIMLKDLDVARGF